MSYYETLALEHTQYYLRVYKVLLFECFENLHFENLELDQLNSDLLPFSTISLRFLEASPRHLLPILEKNKIEQNKNNNILYKASEEARQKIE
jgi:hypothetical protein